MTAIFGTVARLNSGICKSVQERKVSGECYTDTCSVGLGIPVDLSDAMNG